MTGISKSTAKQEVTRLYHYARFDDRSRLERILNDGAIYCSNPRDFNDPWDCVPRFNKTVLDDPQEYEAAVQRFALESKKMSATAKHESAIQMLRESRAILEWMIDQFHVSRAVLSQYRVYCLTIHPDLPLMWSRYSHSHQGYCLEFTVSNELFRAAYPVEYTSRYPEYDPSDSDFERVLKTLLFKSKDWSYEDEYRLIAAAPPCTAPNVPPTENGFLALPGGALRSVIVGSKMSDEARKRVRELVEASGRSVALKAAHVVPGSYSLEIRELE